MNDRKRTLPHRNATIQAPPNRQARPATSRLIGTAASATGPKKSKYDDVAYKKLEGEYKNFKKESEKVAFDVTISERKLIQKVAELESSLESERQRLSEFQELAANDQSENEEKLSKKALEVQELATKIEHLHCTIEEQNVNHLQMSKTMEESRMLQAMLGSSLEKAVDRFQDAEEGIIGRAFKLAFLEEQVKLFRKHQRNMLHEVSLMSRQNDDLQAAVRQLHNKSAIQQSTIETLQSSVSDAKFMLGNTQGTLSDASEREKAKDILILEGERARRRLLVQIEEIKGNIRVYCRVRPLLNATAEAQISLPDRMDNRMVEVLQRRNNATSTSIVEKPITFKYDHVFGPNATQEMIFRNIEPLVESAVDGFRVCILAYGQTGSGKTHTMEGTRDEPGVIPRSFDQIFESTRKLTEVFDWEFAFTCTYIEIYNDVIRDLLVDSEEYRRAVIDRDEVKHEIRHDGKLDTIITGANVVPIRFPHEVEEILQTAHKNRTTARTRLNERSSRSHSVFTVKIEGINAKLKQKNNGVLCLIDLAGSERVSESGALGTHFKEAVNINRSLSHLGDVIAALGGREKRETLAEGSGESAHIPFRNCKLTYLLQNFLGGEGSKVLLLANISPVEEHIQESISTLRFAAKVNATSIGTAKKKVQNV